MKKTSLLIITLLFITTLTACGKKKDENVIVVGASYAPHAEILEQARPLLKEKGYSLKIVKYQDYILPNKNLTDKELDANYFQHIPYLNQYNKEHKTNIVSAGGIHIEPIGIYSKTYNDLVNIDGATVIMSNSTSDEPRLVALLVEKGLITLKDGITPQDVDVKNISNFLASNPKNLKFRNDIDPGLLVTTYKNEKNVLVLINTNFALDGSLKPIDDALALEAGTADNPFVNIIAVRNGDENLPKIEALVEALKSETIKQYIETQYKGAVVAAK